MQKSTVLEKNDFECIFDRFEVLMVITGLADFEKHQIPTFFANGRFFTHF